MMRGFVTVPVIRPNDGLATGLSCVGSPYPSVVSGLPNCGVFVRLKNSVLKCSVLDSVTGLVALLGLGGS